MKTIWLLILSIGSLFLTACGSSSTATVTFSVPLSTPTLVAAASITPTPPSLTPPVPSPTPEASSTFTPLPPTPSPAEPAATPTTLPLTSTPTLEPSATSTSALPTASPTPEKPQGEWRLGQAMPAPARSEMPAVALDNWIYVPGGFGGETRLERYDPVADQWQTLTPMPAGRHHLMAAASGDYLYIFGGAQAPGWDPTATVWQYDPASDSWNELEPMPEARSAGAAVTLDDKIYIAGGAGGSEALLEFTPDSRGWRSLPGPTQPREHVSAVALYHELWVLGGRWSGVGELATVEIYDPATNTWRPGPTMNVARAGFAASVAGDQILTVAGGEVIINGQETLASFEWLTPASSVWQIGPDLPTPMHGVGGAAFANQFLLLGGSLQAGAIQNEGQVQVYELP